MSAKLSEAEIIARIVKATNLSEAEIKEVAQKKKDQLGEMISMNGALTLIASENNVKLDDDIEIDIEDKDSEETKKVLSDTENEDLTLEDLGKKFIKTPKVGEDEIQFTLKKIQKSKDCQAKDKTGTAFSTALPSVDYKIIYITSNDEEFAPKSWEVVGKINAICRKLKKIEGIEISAKHIKDGMLAENKKVDKWEIKAKVDGEYKELDRGIGDWK